MFNEIVLLWWCTYAARCFPVCALSSAVCLWAELPSSHLGSSPGANLGQSAEVIYDQHYRPGAFVNSSMLVTGSLFSLWIHVLVWHSLRALLTRHSSTLQQKSPFGHWSQPSPDSHHTSGGKYRPHSLACPLATAAHQEFWNSGQPIFVVLSLPLGPLPLQV